MALKQSHRTLRSYQKITRTALFIALCVVLGYLFLPVPNLEMITAGIFLSGVWMGPLYGLLIGFLAEAIYSITNPMGFPPPPLLVAQVSAMSLVGLTGGLLGRLLLRPGPFAGRSWIYCILMGGIGAVLTIVYDLLTNLSFPLAAGFSGDQIRIALAMGIPYAAIHIATNAAIFAIIIPVLLNRFPAWRSP